MRENETRRNSTPSERESRCGALADALHQEEMNRPHMPADLNARLMLRVEKEVNSIPEKKRTHIIWPWIAAACVAAVIAVFLTPPKVNESAETGIAKVEKDSVKQQKEIIQDKEPQTLIANVETDAHEKPKVEKPMTADTSRQLAKAEVKQEAVQEVKAEESAAELPANMNNELAAANNQTAEPESRMLTERDIPITRPENYKYTKEELALMKKQAQEAYLKWVELELEISKYNLENTALK